LVFYNYNTIYTLAICICLIIVTSHNITASPQRKEEGKGSSLRSGFTKTRSPKTKQKNHTKKPTFLKTLAMHIQRAETKRKKEKRRKQSYSQWQK